MNMLTRLTPGRVVPTAVRTLDDIFRLAYNGWSEFAPELMRDAMPQLSLEVKEKEVVATLPFPGLTPDDFEVSVEGDRLTVKVDREEEDEESDKRYLRKERSCDSYEETVSLPVKVCGNEAKASYKDGVLTVTIAREEPEAPKTHTVKVN